MSTVYFKLASSALIDADNLANASERLLNAVNTATAALEQFEASGSEDIMYDAMVDVSECWNSARLAVFRYRKQASKVRLLVHDIQK